MPVAKRKDGVMI